MGWKTHQTALKTYNQHLKRNNLETYWKKVPPPLVVVDFKTGICFPNRKDFPFWTYMSQNSANQILQNTCLLRAALGQGFISHRTMFSSTKRWMILDGCKGQRHFAILRVNIMKSLKTRKTTLSYEGKGLVNKVASNGKHENKWT